MATALRVADHALLAGSIAPPLAGTESPQRTVRAVGPLLKCKRILLSVLLIALAACGTGGDEMDDYFPTESGKRWTYRLTRTTMDGTRVQPYYVEHRGPVLLAGRADLVLEQRTFDGNRYFFARDPARGWLRIGAQIATDEAPRWAAEPWLVLPASLDVGRSWQQMTPVRVLEKTGPPQETLFRVQVSLPVEYRIAARDDRVEVPAGSFHGCLRIEGRGSISTHLGNYLGLGSVTVESTAWFAPGVGLIKQRLVERTNRPALDHGEMHLELTQLNRP